MHHPSLRRHARHGLLLIGLLGLTACGGDSNQPFSTGNTTDTPVTVPDAALDYWPTEGWQTGDEASHGFTAGAFDTLAADAASALPYHTSLMVIRDGWILHESYNSPASSTIDATYKHNVWSVAKSVTSMTVGRAHSRGDLNVPLGLASPDVLELTVEDVYPADVVASLAIDDPRRQITLRHVLQMKSGLAWNEPAWLINFSAMRDPLLLALSGQAPATCPDNEHTLLCVILNQPLAHAPGTVWNYNTYDSYLISGFFTQLTGTDLAGYAAEHLFNPVGMSVTPDSDWLNFPSVDYTFGGGLLHITTRDLGRLGMLMLYDGHWAGEQLISRDWITMSTTPQGAGFIAAFGPDNEPLPTPVPINLEYGMQWWTTTGVMSGPKALTARGLGGQFMQIYKDKELIILITSDESSYPETLPYRSTQINDFIKTHILDRLTD